MTGKTNCDLLEVRSFITPSSSKQKLDTESIVDMNDFELTPLDCELPVELVHQRKKSDNKKNATRILADSWRGPLRAAKLILLAAVVPALFIFVPLYLRYHVFSGQLYPVGMSDMRLIDKKVSTTWCQRQVVRSNATFNAFLMSSSPEISKQIHPVSMTRQLRLEDDMKEYWGFYLLEGSMVTVSSCVRWPGASLIMIRGHRHLKECAYIGDDSSEELEEVLRANGGILTNATLQKLIDQPSNRPKNMTRHLSGVRFHEPRPLALKTDSAEEFHTQPHDEDKDLLDPKMLEIILAQLKQTQEKNKKNRDPHVRPSNIVPVQRLTHRYRETNVNEQEEKFLSFKDLEVSDEITKGKNEEVISGKNNEPSKDHAINITEVKYVEVEEMEEIVEIANDENENSNKEVNKMAATDDIKDDFQMNKNTTLYSHTKDIQLQIIPVAVDETPLIEVKTIKNHEVKEQNDDKQSSSEVFEDIYNKLERLGDKGKGVIKRLNSKLTSLSNASIVSEGQDITTNNTKSNEELFADLDDDSLERIADKKIEALKNLLTEVLTEEIRAKKARQARKKKENIKRLKRELIIEQKLQDVLTEDDEKGNAAIEDEFEPDGIADHHMRLNESTLNDMSRSEFWSSFSSSEEALLECDGLILNLPLTPHKQCEETDLSKNKHDEISRANTVTYRVPTNGYYFFVFNSENEVQVNYIRVRFDLKKTVYDLNSGKVMECKNSTEQCTMPLSFFSGEKVVFEVPVRDNDSLWNDDFVVISECEPRTLIYLFCVIAVPVLILLMALH